MPVQPHQEVNPFTTPKLGVLRLVTPPGPHEPFACPVLFGPPPQPADVPEKPQEPPE